MDADGVAPGLAEFELILRAFSESGQFDSVEEVFDEMLLRGLVPLVAVYNVYVGALCRKGELAGARRMVECMERAGCPPDVRTFGIVVAGCVSAGDVDAAREVALEATSQGLRWDSPELIGSLHAGGDHVVARAHPLLLKICLLHDGCARLDALAFEHLRGALCKQGLCPEPLAAGLVNETASLTRPGPIPA